MFRNKTKLLAKLLVSFAKSHALTVFISCAAILCGTVFVGTSAKTVLISDGEKTYAVHSVTGDVDAALKCAGITEEFEILETEVRNNRTDVKIAYTFPVHITVGKETVTVNTIPATVGTILSKAGFTVDKDDMVEPSKNKKITKTTYIDYTDIEYVNGSYTEAIPHTMETVYSSSQLKGVTTTVAGKDGVQQITYVEKLVNGVSAEKIVKQTLTLSAAVNGKNIVGTFVPKAPAVTTIGNIKTISTLTPPYNIELDANGVPVNYTKRMTVQATAYTYTGHNCSTGVAPQPGYVAVNPKYIPYGTRMFIKSSDGRYIYGYAVAADTGGFIKTRPTNIDLFFSTKSACTAFGRRNIEVYILP